MGKRSVRAARAAAVAACIAASVVHVPEASATWEFVYGEPTLTPDVASGYGDVALHPDGSTYVSGSYFGSYHGYTSPEGLAQTFVEKIGIDGESEWLLPIGDPWEPVSTTMTGPQLIIDGLGNVYSFGVGAEVLKISDEGTVSAVSPVGMQSINLQPAAAGGFTSLTIENYYSTLSAPVVLHRYGVDMVEDWQFDFSTYLSYVPEFPPPAVLYLDDGSFWVVGGRERATPFGQEQLVLLNIDQDGELVTIVRHYGMIPVGEALGATSDGDVLWIEAADTADSLSRVWAFSATDGQKVGSSSGEWDVPPVLTANVGLDVGPACESMGPFDARKTLLNGERQVVVGTCFGPPVCFVTVCLSDGWVGKFMAVYSIDDQVGTRRLVSWKQLSPGMEFRSLDADEFGNVVVVGASTDSVMFVNAADAEEPKGVATSSSVAERAVAARNPTGSLWRGLRAAGSVLELKVTGREGVPEDAEAVVLNVTVTQPWVNGFVTVFPCGSALPEASNVNFVAGQTVPNAVVAKVGTGGRVCVYAKQPTHLVVDVGGFFPSASALEPLVPERVLDSRVGVGQTKDGQFQRTGRLPAGGVMELVVAGRAGVPGDASAVVLNVTAMNAANNGFVTVYPCGSPRPPTSTVNLLAGGSPVRVAGQTVPNLTVSKVGSGGKVCLYSLTDVDLIVDVGGYFPAGNEFVPLVPARLLETRLTAGTTVDGLFWKVGRVSAGGVVQLTVAGRGGVPLDAGAVALNVTATNAAANGFVTVYPCGAARPPSSSLNAVAGRPVANAVVGKVGSGGKVCLYSLVDIDLVVDVNGYFPAASSYEALVPFRPLDTR